MAVGVSGVRGTRSLTVILLVVASFGISIPSAFAKSCYRVVDANSLYIRAEPDKSAGILTAVKGGALVIKAGLPVCGIWWCKVTTGKYIGFVGSKYLKKTDCP